MSLQLLWLQNYGFWTSRTRAACAYSAVGIDVYTLPRRDHGSEGRKGVQDPPKGGVTSLLDPTEKLWITTQTAAKTHLPDGKTPWQWRTERRARSTKGRRNVPSGSDRKDFNHSPNCSQNTSAGWENTMAVKDGKACKIHQTGRSTSLLDPTEKISITVQTAAKTHLLVGSTPWQWRTERRARSTRPDA